MLPAQANAKHTRNTRANTKNQKSKPKASQASNNPVPFLPTSKSKQKPKNPNCANESEPSVQDPTISTGIIHRRNAGQDGKLTVKKVPFESKPVIRELSKRLGTLPKQYIPEYFVSILEFLIEKEVTSTIAPTAHKIGKWRQKVDRQREIEDQVRREMTKVTNNIITGRKKLKKEQTKSQKITKSNTQSDPNDPQKYISTDCHPYTYSQSQSQNTNTNCQPIQESQNSSTSVHNTSCPSLHGHIWSPLTDKKLGQELDQRFDQFAGLIQIIYDVIGENQCSNTIFPTCYIFFTMCCSDMQVYSLLSRKTTTWDLTPSYESNSFPSQGLHRLKSQAPSPMQLVEYYMIASILIATKYHEIHPASLMDLIDSVNCSLSYDYAIRVEGQILELLDFRDFFPDHEAKVLSMFVVVAGWGVNEGNVCHFMLESGLNNPKLYQYSPLYKAAVVMGLYEEQFLKSQQKFMQIKSLCPGLTLELANTIKKEYSQVIVYNWKNRLHAQKKKYCIFDNEVNRIVQSGGKY